MEPLSIFGNVGNDLQLRYTPNGKAVIDINIALYAGKDQAGEKETQWCRASLWSELAEKASTNIALHKGSRVQVTGIPKPIRVYIDGMDMNEVTDDTKVKFGDIRTSWEMTGFNCRLVEKAEVTAVDV